MAATNVSQEGLSPSQEEDEALVVAVQRGDATAFRGLMEKYQNRVHAVAYGMTRDREESRDITQETFIRAYRKLGEYRAEASFRAWLFRIAMNLAIDTVRRGQRRRTTGFDEARLAVDDDGAFAVIHREDGPGRLLERKRLHQRILAAIDELNEDHRQIILLREVENLSYKDISEILDIPEGTVMSRLYHARKKLQVLLADEVSPPEGGTPTE
jgi:RNA polymerase sigma-70 factor, ECF subfamily